MYNAAALRFFLLAVASFAISGGEGTTSEPDLPQITGAFDVELLVRFNMVTGQFQNLFQYTDPGGANTIELLQNDNVLWLQINLAFCNVAGIPVVLGQNYMLRFGVTPDNIAYIFRDGVLEKVCHGMPVPANLQRDIFLGDGPSATALRGAVVGIRVLHWEQETPYSQVIMGLNIPGQAFQDGLEATFHARFDSLGDRSEQRAFEFGTGVGANLNWCGQMSNTTTMECGIVEDGVPYVVTAPNAIEEGVFAFWKFRVESGGTFRLEKNDGAQVWEVTHPMVPRTRIFRQLHFFGDSANVANDDLDGAVIGVRLQRLGDS